MTIQRRSSSGIKVFMGVLFLLLAFMVLSYSDRTGGTLIGILFSVMGVALMVVEPRIELDFAHDRFRTYSVPLLARKSDFKPMPVIDRIQVRDVLINGGSTRSISPGYWGDTFACEVFLLTADNEKLLICQRTNKAKIIRAVEQLVEASGLPVRDMTQVRVLTITHH